MLRKADLLSAAITARRKRRGSRVTTGTDPEEDNAITICDTCGTSLSNTTNDHGSVSKEYRTAAASFATLTG